MSIFDVIKKAVFGEKMPEKPVMKVCMLGARGVGKTSVLTSMYNNTNSAVCDTNLHISAEPGTAEILNKKLIDLKRMFIEDNDENDMVQTGIAGDNKVSTFEFSFGMNTENVNMGIEIKDYPGEYVKDEPTVVMEYIKESNAVIVAIDTPHLMEVDGKYNEGKNRTVLITDLFKASLNSSSDEKLILFVPLKCEKYFYEGRIDEVNSKVKESYAELIEYLKDRNDANGLKGKFACVISPILTVGEIVFDKFEAVDDVIQEYTDETGIRIPKAQHYKYLKSGAKYSPEFCEQPLVYLLAFVSKQYMKLKEQKEAYGIISKIKKMLELSPKTNLMLVEMQKLSEKKVDRINGYSTLFGRGKL